MNLNIDQSEQLEVQPQPKLQADSEESIPSLFTIGQEFDLEAAMRPLTEHDQFIIKQCYQNMDMYENGEQYKLAFFEQYTKCLTRSITGVQPLTGPTGLAFIRNLFVPEKFNPYIEFGRDIELMHDIKALDNSDIYRGMIIDSRSAKVCVCAASRYLDHISQWANILDLETISTLEYIAQPGTWNNAEIPNRYIIVHPDKYNSVPSSLRSNLYTSSHVSPTSAVIGWKESNFGAPVYFMPYLPFTNGIAPTSGRLRHRYGLVADPRHTENTFVWKVAL